MTREDFKRIPELRREISRALILWENAIESATRKTSLITGMPKSGNTTSQVENAVIKSEVYKEKYDLLCEEQKDIYKRLQIDSKRVLNEQETKMLDMVYPQGMKMADIAKKLNITERHAYRIKKTALRKICW